ncbi:MAG TPA: SpoIID/LytB domain-containing protein [Actinomycetota bacterium]|nr:SpoIID/LytB domain-containing protein [Actinomycetota bacterium]
MTRTARLWLVVVLGGAAFGTVVPPETAFAAPTRLRITVPDDGSMLVHGEYPPVQSSCVDPEQPVLHARYRGTIEVVARDDGSVALIGELPFEDYIKGIAEVPRDWPMEALKAQVVAARTYALNRLQAGTGGDYDLCATTACQVYVGMEVEAGPWGDRWIRAVDQTAGQILVYEGEPAITYYSSTSPGHTFDVEDVFGGEALPYLRGQDEPDDGASPVAHWRVEVPFGDLARVLAASGLHPGGRIRSVGVGEGGIRIAGRRAVTVSKDGLRDTLNEWAECLMPDRYPTFEPDGYQLPQTVPSIWYRVRTEGDALVLAGRGWGHGIGMVQWGAYGKARRGLGYADILAEYYGGLRPTAVDLPGTIRILIAEGLQSVTVAPSDPATTNPSVGPSAPWRITARNGVRVRHSGQPRPLLRIDEVRLPRTAAAGQPVPVRLTASDDVTVRVDVLGSDGPRVPKPFEAGPIRFPETMPSTAGRYRVQVTASNGVDTVASRPVSIVVEPASSPEASPSESPSQVAAPPPGEAEPERTATVALVAGALIGLAMVGLLVLTARRRKGLHRR